MEVVACVCAYVRAYVRARARACVRGRARVCAMGHSASDDLSVYPCVRACMRASASVHVCVRDRPHSIVEYVCVYL